MSDIQQILRRIVLVTKAGSQEVGDRGVLVGRMEVGAPLVVLLGGTRQLTTSRIRSVSELPDGCVEVCTANSSYAVRYLHPPT